MNRRIKTLSLILSTALLISLFTAFAPTVFAAPDSWGKQVIVNGISFYVDAENGKTSAEVTNGICWLQESSDGTSTWYGLDNTNGDFPYGSRFWVDWVSLNDGREYDELVKERSDNNKTRIFLWGVEGPDGIEISVGHDTSALLIQLGSDWEFDDVEDVLYSKYPDSKIESINYNIAGTSCVVARVSFPGYSNWGGHTAGSIFTSNNLALVGGCTAIAGASICVCALVIKKKNKVRKEKQVTDHE